MWGLRNANVILPKNLEGINHLRYPDVDKRLKMWAEFN
jgi:hypothetical protein